MASLVNVIQLFTIGVNVKSLICNSVVSLNSGLTSVVSFLTIEECSGRAMGTECSTEQLLDSGYIRLMARPV